MANGWGNSDWLSFSGLQNDCRWWLQPWNSKMHTPWKESYHQSRKHIKKQDITLPTKVHLVKAMVFLVVMYKCASWSIKKAECKELMFLNCGVGEDSWESLGLQGDPTSPSSRWSVLGVHWKDCCWSWNSNTLAPWCEELSHLKRPRFWANWGQEEKGTTEDEMVGWRHWLNGHGLGWAPRVGDGQGGLACCSSWGRKELDTTEQLNWSELSVS